MKYHHITSNSPTLLPTYTKPNPVLIYSSFPTQLTSIHIYAYRNSHMGEAIIQQIPFIVMSIATRSLKRKRKIKIKKAFLTHPISNNINNEMIQLRLECLLMPNDSFRAIAIWLTVAFAIDNIPTAYEQN